jgi:beta-aspartyl-dipeptidase (metallo-type)
MFTILQKGEVFSPQPLGVKDILIAGGKIAAVSKPDLLSIKGVDVQKIDASGKYIFPGFIDSHVHILGGGGEGGPSSRAPEITLKDIITSGVTTVIGCLGTDAITRHMSSLLAKARGLEEEGISTYIFSGSYEVPVKTISGSIRSDLVIIDKVIGAGEIAISDHRSSQPSFEEFARLAAECRVGGMLGGKAGVLHCHLGDGKRKLELILRLINETEIPPTQVIPTHSNRNLDLLAEAVTFMQLGGYIDLTAGPDPGAMEEKHLSIASSIRYCQDNNVPLDQITISSDSNGSMPVFDKKGKLISLTISTQKSLLANFRYLIQKNVISMEDAARLFSTNSAIFYKFKQKGKIKPGMDADMIILDKDLDLIDSFTKGKRMMAEGNLIT